MCPQFKLAPSRSLFSKSFSNLINILRTNHSEYCQASNLSKKDIPRVMTNISRISRDLQLLQLFIYFLFANTRKSPFVVGYASA